MDWKNQYLDVNKSAWNKKVDVHLQSAFYDVKGFMEGQTSLNDIELTIIGDVSQKSILHLQCHFGQDSMSLSRLGAQVVGVDLSDEAIKAAKYISNSLNLDTKFVCCNVYDLPSHLEETFDLVFTSYGTIAWLPDLDRWASLIARYLKPRGRFVIVDFHPFIWMYDDDLRYIKYNYFNVEPIIENESGTYADKNADLSDPMITWNHSLSEVVNSLIRAGLTIQNLNEYNYSPYNVFKDMEEVGPKKYQISQFSDRIPLVFSIEAVNLLG